MYIDLCLSREEQEKRDTKDLVVPPEIREQLASLDHRAQLDPRAPKDHLDTTDLMVEMERTERRELREKREDLDPLECLDSM